jgi:hypothetical protein
MDTQSIDLWSGIINNIMGSLGLLAGGIWVYWNFVYQRTGTWNLKMTVTPESVEYSGELRLLKINITLLNEGNTKISPGPSGCRITVRRLEKNSAAGQLLDYNSGEVVVDELDVLRRYLRPGIGYKMYEIEPRSEYHEVEALVVKKGDLFSIKTVFWYKGDKDSITEYSLCRVD